MAAPLDHSRDTGRLGGGNLTSLNERSREIFRHIVDSYLINGEAVGSRHVARLLPMSLSPASVRNVMQDLEELGLIYAPHTSAGGDCRPSLACASLSTRCWNSATLAMASASRSTLKSKPLRRNNPLRGCLATP